MATRSTIAIQREGTKTILAIYCHWDGYYSHNGALLLENYPDEDDIMSLIENGNLSVLKEEIGEQHDFDSRDHDTWCKFYGRDRGETEQEAREYNSLAEFEDAESQEYIYLFRNGKWQAKQGGQVRFRDLTPSRCKS